MPGKFHHESLYRGDQIVRQLGELRIVLCGAGAIGSNLADNLVRQGATRLRVIDHDKIEEHNVSTQLYGESDVGGAKVDVLRSRLFRTAGVEIEAVRKELTESNAQQMLREADLVIDTFDNSKSRRLVQEMCRALGLTCLHVGLSADYCEIIWDETYRVPADVGADVCDYPLARNLVTLSVSIASETIFTFLATRERKSWSATLADFAVQTM